MKNHLENTYLKQLKNGHLKLLLKLYLQYRGWKDARKQIIHVNEDGIYVSPLIYHEIYLFNLAVHAEEERLIRSTMSLQAEMDIFQLQIEQKELLMNSPDPTAKLYSDKGSDLKQIITTLKTKKQELQSLKNLESEISQTRSKQMYNVLQAKISAYWNGILLAGKKDFKIPPLIIIDQLIQGGEPFHETE